MRGSITGALLCCVLLSMGAAAGGLTVSQRNKAFVPSQVSLHVGEYITFVNEDTITHSLYSETAGTEFELLQRPGQSSAPLYAMLQKRRGALALALSMRR